MTTPTILLICATCGMKKDATGTKPTNPASVALAGATAALLADTDVTVKLTKCLSMCDEPIAWALQSPTRHATAFAPATTPDDLATTARLYITTPLGEKMPKKDLPREVRASLKSRIPPLE